MILLKTNKNESWQFFYEPNRGLCQRRGNHIPQLLYPDGCEDFDANCDEQGRIHIIATNADRDLVYFVHDGHNWQQHTLLKSRGSAVAGRFRLLPVGRWQNLFYTLMLEDRTLLIHHIIDAPTSPAVLDCVEGSFACALSDHDSIALLYKKKEGLFTREYQWNQKQWSEPIALSQQGEIADCICLPDGTLGTLTYSPDTIFFHGKESLVIEAETPLPPCLAYVDGILWIVWEEAGRIRACRSEDGGAHFDAPTRFLTSAPIQRFSVRPTRFPHATCNFALGSVGALSVIGKRFSEPFPTPAELRRMGQEVEELAENDELFALRAEIARLKKELEKTANHP